MDSLKITGGRPLRGTIPISGAKNAALPLMCAALLTAEPLALSNVPDLADIKTLSQLLAQHGVKVDASALKTDNTLTLQAKAITSDVAPYELVRKMRASVLVLGALLARHGSAKVSLPGGCAIGTRPVDVHLKGLEKMGAAISIEAGYINAAAPEGGLKGAEISMPFVSVGATENLLMAAVLARGETVLLNAAREPEVSDLAHCLIAMGATIEGIGTDTLTIQGVKALHGAAHRVIPDRIETGTYCIAAAITGGELELTGTDASQLAAFLTALRGTGVAVTVQDSVISVNAAGIRPRGVDIMTEPHPGFPTDLQAQFMALMTICDGAAMLTETIFENRFMHVPELTRMGAGITVHGSSAMVRGAGALTAAPVMASDLRASAALVLAALAAPGETRVHRIYHLDRGYERMVEKLTACGAVLERIKEDQEAA